MKTMMLIFTAMTISAGLTAADAMPVAPAQTVAPIATTPAGIGSPAPVIKGAEVLRVYVDTAKKADDAAAKPEFKVSKDSVDISYKSGKIYVIEFWTVWCPPCLISIPHLNKLQAKYGDKVQFIGVAPEVRQTRAKVLAFLEKKKQPEMNYTVIWDAQQSAMKDFFTVYNAKGFPTAFIVDRNGKVAWQGHPLEIDEPLQNIVEK